MFQTLNSLIRQNKKSALLLLLLTSAVLVSCDRNLTSSSLTGSSSSTGSNSTSASVSSSVEEFNGSEVPNWNLTNPIITEGSTGVSTGLSRQYFGRYEGNLYLASGLTPFASAPTNTQIGNRTYVVINQSLGTEVVRLELNPGQTYIDWALSNNQNDYWGNERFTIEGNLLYVSMTLYPQGQFNTPASRLGGDYQVFINEIDSRYAATYTDLNGRYQRQYRVFFTYNITSQAIVIRDMSDSYQFELTEVLAENNTLYAILNVIKTTNQINPYTIFPTTTITAPTLTPNNSRYGVLFELDLSDLSIKRVQAIGATNDVYTYFNSFRRGFEIVNFDNDGNLFVNFNFNFNVETRTAIATSINAFNTTLLNGPDLAAMKTEALTKVQDYYDLLSQEVTITNFSFNINLSGGYDATINGLTSYFTGTNFWYYNNTTQSSYEGNNWVSYFEYDDESFVIENYRVIKWLENQQGNFNFFYSVPAIAQKTTVSRLNITTRVKTELISFEDEGVFINGIFRHTNGFYLTGAYFNNPLNKSTEADAFLASYSTSFVKQSEIILGGTKTDVGANISLDDDGKPVWVVQSNSTDGDFAFAATENPNNLNRLYFVRFN